MVEFVHAKGGIDYATAKMIQYKDDAIKVLEQYPMNEAHRSLIDLVNYIVERNN